jgi:hypothetical protein
MFLNTHGLCLTMGIVTGGKKSSWNCPLRISPCKAEVLEAHKMVHEIVFAGPKKTLFVNLIDYVMSLSHVSFCWFEWRGLGDSISRSANGFLMML